MALEILWSRLASKRFDSIHQYLIKEYGVSSATLFTKDVFDFLEILSDFPDIGTIENEWLNTRGFVIERQITVYYKIRKEKIILLNFYDNRQKPKKKKY